MLSESIVAVKIPFLISTLLTDVLVELVKVNATLELVAETLPSAILPVVPLAVRILVVPLVPSNKILEVVGEKEIDPLFAVTSTLVSSFSRTTLVNVTFVAATTSALKTKSFIFANAIAPVVDEAVELSVTLSFFAAEPEMLMLPADKAPVD